MNHDTIDTIAWLCGIITLTIGCGLQWGWPVSLIVPGAVFTLWPLVKSLAR